jgi:hypothetical protein
MNAHASFADIEPPSFPRRRGGAADERESARRHVGARADATPPLTGVAAGEVARRAKQKHQNSGGGSRHAIEHGGARIANHDDW